MIQTLINLFSHNARPAIITTESVAKIIVYKKYNMCCAICGIATKGKPNEMDAPELDHIIPLSKAGDHVYSNVQLLCRSCNLKKSAKAPIYHVITEGRTYNKRSWRLSRQRPKARGRSKV